MSVADEGIPLQQSPMSTARVVKSAKGVFSQACVCPTLGGGGVVTPNASWDSHMIIGGGGGQPLPPWTGPPPAPLNRTTTTPLDRTTPWTTPAPVDRTHHHAGQHLFPGQDTPTPDMSSPWTGPSPP